jgi:UDP-N-acetylbacillosamine N-acetyltransferase
MGAMTRKTPIVVWGASGHARVVVDILGLLDAYEVIGFLDDVNPERKGEIFCGQYVLGGQEQLPLLRAQGVGHLVFGFGQCAARLRLAKIVRQNGFTLPALFHPKATIAADVAIGEGTLFAAGSVTGAGAVIGDLAIINTCASVGHECTLGDGVHICPGVHLGGGTRVGAGSWIGIGATVIDHLTIGAGVLIGAGAVVVEDIPDGVVAYGAPARPVRAVGYPP